ncbi:tail fiber assembly protein [Pantoea ananatis]|uniref:tail fiber assembly protein n=1 Tax=Pantoea ananas TaxID=553 RepID=UPI003FA48752
MNYLFSASTNGFYPSSMKGDYVSAGSWPDDLIEVSDADYSIYSGIPPEGKTRGSDKGKPAWVDLPQPTKAQQVVEAINQKSNLMTKATNTISPLQDAVDLDMATDEEKVKLTAWKKYRVLLNRVDTSSAPDITWPEIPVN